MPIRRYAAVAAALLAVAFVSFAAPARAELTITIDKSAQRMTVALFGDELFVWPVSTGAQGYDTPSGEFTPFRMERTHFSREWDDAPMPHSIFFTQTGHAIHGSNHRKAIGTPASHGCVRLEPKNARILFDLVRQERMKNTRVVLVGETPAGAEPPAVASRDNGGDYQRSYSTDDEDAVATTPRRQRSARWREYRDGPRYFYYRERPYYAPRRYGYGAPFPFPFFGR